MKDTAETQPTSDQKARQRTKENTVSATGLALVLLSAALFQSNVAFFVFVVGIACTVYMLDKGSKHKHISETAYRISKVGLITGVLVFFLLFFAG